MTNREIILKAMDQIHQGKASYVCNALSRREKTKRLADRFVEFMGVRNDPCIGIFGGHNAQENQEARLTALALFLVAEKDVLG